jgi:tRNA(Ile)-lysidine synthase
VSPSLHADFLTQSKKRRYLLGISGGRDSVALLHLLLDAGYHNLVLCHLNHSLRGKASGQDAALVRRLAKKYDLPCETGRVDVPKLMVENGDSMELAARKARHQFFADCASTYRCKRILLAHHADDQAETILFNLLRGSHGLKGMYFSTVHQVNGKKLHLLRPLLDVARSEINDYLTAHKITFREDASNAEGITTRNRLRNEAMPLLNEIMGREIRPALVRAAVASHAQQTAITSVLTSLKLTDPQGRLFLPKLAVLSPALQSSAIHHHLKQHHISNISHELLARCCQLISDQSVAKVNLPGGKFLRRKEKRIFVS